MPKPGSPVRQDPRTMMVSDLMSREVISCALEADLAEVASVLARRGVHGIVVVDNRGRPVGVVSDFDLLAGEWLADDDAALRTMRAMTAEEIMTPGVESIAADASATEAARRMRELHVSRLLVLDRDGTAVGVIAISDLVAPFGTPSLERHTVDEVMSRAVVTCPPDTSLAAAARAMTERRSRSIVVVDDGGRAIGVITGSDLLRLYDSVESDQSVVVLATAPVITADPAMPLSRAADLMLDHEVHRLVVVDQERLGVPVGLVSTSDIVAAMATPGSAWQRSKG